MIPTSKSIDMYKIFILLWIFYIVQQQQAAEQNNQEWAGRWFPEDPHPNNISTAVKHQNHGAPMGIIGGCDDGKAYLQVDYSGTPEQYTCFENQLVFLPNAEIHPVLEHDRIPKAYSAPHYCMNESIVYKNPIPTFGGHRPVWPKYGEYHYVPPQRWLHSLEHGAIVMLYHPCANSQEVVSLKDIVRNCMFRHIISAENKLHPDRPLALLAWGHRLFMSKFDANIAIKFITKYANRAPEKTTKDGNYTMSLTIPATKVSNDKDNKICYKFTRIYSL